MSHFNKAQVIMLPTENKVNGIIVKEIVSNKLQQVYKEDCQHEDFVPQHLYIISDDKIEKGDWYISNGKVYQHPVKEFSKSLPHAWYGGKIVATTDKSVRFATGEMFPEWEYLPQPSEQFLEKYIDAYNRGEVITDVLVEYEETDKKSVCVGMSGKPSKPIYNWIGNWKLKVNSDNTINIKSAKESWNREELVLLFKKHEEDIIKYINSSTPSATPSFNDMWIKENL